MKYLFCLMLLLVAHISGAHESHTMSQKSTLAMSVAFDAQGNLWRVREQNGFVLVDKSEDVGKTFSAPLTVNQAPQKIGADGEARPKIAIGPEGNIYLTWTEALKAPFSGYIWFARSTNKGKSFEKPIIVHQNRDEITHRFDALNVASDGKITVLWVDKRDLIAAKIAGAKYDGAAIYAATSSNQGASFAPEQKLADNSCECCRIATANKPDGAGSNSTVVAMWRHVYAGSERDHAMAEIPVNGQAPNIHRATFGRWKIDGCPHQGAALATGGEGKDWWGYHMAWFDGGGNENGKDASLFYARMDGEAWVSSPPKKFGNRSNKAGHPTLLSQGENVWLVWQETLKNADKSRLVMGMFSDDGGRSWGEAKTLASTTSNADYPQLLAKNNTVYLVWNTEAGLQMIVL